MILVDVESFFDGSKIIFYFYADGRVDFRELVKDLVKKLHTRVELRQIGVRNKAKMIGGVGPCGRELCCAYIPQGISFRLGKDGQRAKSVPESNKNIRGLRSAHVLSQI